MTVAIYARVSSDKQRDAHTIESQQNELMAFAKEQKMVVDDRHVYLDNGWSGYHFERPALDQLRDAARDGLIDAVLIHDPDRLARRYAYQVLLLEEFQRVGVQVKFLNQPPPDNPDQRLLLQIQGAIAEYERAKIMERTRRGRLFWLKQGRPTCAQVPYGYLYHKRTQDTHQTIEVSKAEAEWVRKIFKWFIEKKLSYRQIALKLTGQSVPTPRSKNKPWDLTTVGFILRNEAYIGNWHLNKYKSVPDVAGGKSRTVKRPRAEWITLSVPAIIDAETFALAQKQIKSRTDAGTKPIKYPHSHLLRKLVFCSSCGRKMSCHARQDGYHQYYWCRGKDPHGMRGEQSRCPNPTTISECLDQLVWNDVCSLLTEPKLILSSWKGKTGCAQATSSEIIDREQQLIKRQLKEIEKQKCRLLVAYEQEVIDLTEMSSRRTTLDERQRELAARQSKIVDQLQQAVTNMNLEKNIDQVCKSVSKGLSKMTMPERMTLCSRLIERVEIGNGTANIKYRFPVSHQCNLRGEGVGLFVQIKAVRQLPG